MFGLVLVSDGQNEDPLNNGSDIYCSGCSPLDLRGIIWFVSHEV